MPEGEIESCPTFFQKRVVHLEQGEWYDICIKHEREVLDMNTDKIYAESIANEYSVKKTSKVVALKKLDRKAKRGANIFAYTFGIVSALVLGTGMCLSMDVIGNGTQMSFICGIIIGVIGIVGVAVNYPIYKKIKKSGMEKYAGDIIRLANEISERSE